jgi:hypothetical protein
MMKKLKIDEVLDQDSNFTSFYDKNETPEKALPAGYSSWQEYNFYGEDTDFMRFHKRTKQNMQETLQELIQSSKQTLQKGIRKMNSITINYIELNKASSLLIAYWTVNSLDFSQISDKVVKA